jgi:hypothetical protein
MSVCGKSVRQLPLVCALCQHLCLSRSALTTAAAHPPTPPHHHT